MAPRIGFTHRVIMQMDPCACEDDPRLAWRSGDESNLGIHDPRDFPGVDVYTNLPSLNPRQMRSIAAQLLKHADALDRIEPHCEIVLE